MDLSNLFNSLSNKLEFLNNKFTDYDLIDNFYQLCINSGSKGIITQAIIYTIIPDPAKNKERIQQSLKITGSISK